ncbi:MAG: helix-turn-helix domain-containing protein [Clostridiales bacterium]|nr:helix-turn-helix domain-containing protein [Clostridiales bacterium]
MADNSPKMIKMNALITDRKKKSTITFQFQDMRNDNVIGRKLTEARKSKNVSQKELPAILSQYGNSITPAAISKWEKGESIPSALQLLALSDIFGITDIRNYFLGDVPESPAFSPELNQKGLNILQSFKEALITSGQFVPKERRRTTKYFEQIQKISKAVSKLPVSAGTGNFLDEDNFEMKEFPSSPTIEAADFGLRVSGDSMMPTYTDNQIVWVEQCEELNPGEIGIFIYDGCGYIKEYQEVMPDEEEMNDYLVDGVIYPKVLLVSHNKEYEPIEINPALGFQIVGRVLN